MKRQATVEMIVREIFSIIGNTPYLSTTKQCYMPNSINSNYEAMWDWGWGMESRLVVKFPHKRPNGGMTEPEIYVTWGTISYSPARARTVAILHSAVADLACQIGALLEEVEIIREED